VTHNILWLLDLDRTLLKTEELIRRYIDGVQQVTGDVSLVDAMHERWHAVEGLGQPYDFSGQVKETMTEYEIVAIDHFVSTHVRAGELLESGAAELLTALTDLNLIHGIMTYGPPDRQLFKLRITELDTLPYLVSDTPNKAAVIKSWWHDNAFEVPASLFGQMSRFNTIALVDDKAVAFYGMPAAMRGFLYRPAGTPLLKSQEGDIEEGVVILHKLQDLIPFLEN